MNSSFQTFFKNESPRKYVEIDVQLNDFPEQNSVFLKLKHFCLLLHGKPQKTAR